MMSPQTAPQSDAKHDETLIDWSLSLSPAERLAELESRIAFFYAARGDVVTIEIVMDCGDASTAISRAKTNLPWSVDRQGAPLR
ncbi:MAG TPA: hypothetical protein VFO94_10255 [Gammaproteobacteria bacterium]|nr:hypothetical protein [Gammaproteobacteria bacterium]